MCSKLKIVLCIWVVLLFCIHSFGQTVTMKEYVDRQVELLEEMNKLRDEHLKEISRIKDENIRTAYASQDKRLDGMNEFRETLKDSNSTYVTWQALIGLIIGVSGFLFGYATYKRNQELDRNNKGRNIQSGDTVEVKK